MTNIYQVEKETILDLLNHIDDFTDKMENFIKEYPQYDYELNIYKNHNNLNKPWIVEAKVTTDEEEKLKSRKTMEGFI